MTVQPVKRRHMVGSTTEENTTLRSVRAVPNFESFYRGEYRAVVGLAYALSGSRLAAEDIAQDAFLAAHRQWDRVGFYEQPEAWVRRVVANLAGAAFRTKVREVGALARLKPREEYLPRLPVEDADFWKAVRSLPQRQAQVIALHYLEDRPVAEIARALGGTANTAKGQLRT